MRILMASARYLPYTGGTETHIQEVAQRLVGRGHSVTVVTTDRSWILPAHETRRGIEVVRARAWPRNQDIYWAPGILSEIEDRDADVVHVQGYHTLTAPLAMMAAARKRVPFVITFHSGGHSSRLRNAVRFVQHKALQPFVARAAAYVGVSEFEARFFSARMGIPLAKFAVIPNGARLPEASPAARPRDAKNPIVVSIGRLERYKGHHRVINAFAHLLKTMPQARLKIVGEGAYETQLRRLSARPELRGRVEISAISAAARGSMADVLSEASVVALLSEYEAHPVAVMEALSVGTPVLTSDTSGFAELAAQGLTRAVSLKATDAEIAEALATEILSPRPVERAALPTWEGCTDALESIYASVARARGPFKDHGARGRGRSQIVTPSPVP